MSRVLIGATNYGSWAEELQAPWDALTKAGHEVTLATPRGLKPLPLAVSVDQDFVDPIQNVKVNPPQVRPFDHICVYDSMSAAYAVL